MMFYMFKEHHVSPSVFYNMEETEKIIYRAFYECEVDCRKGE